jgi:ABC-type nickel/cobalt efflux system permease component RcnA
MFLRLSTLLILASLLFAAPASAADYFGRPDEASSAAPAPARQTPESLPLFSSPSIALPAPLRSALGGLIALQSRLNAELRSHLRAARDDPSPRPAMVIVLFSFLYGVFHAVGPGHGKLVVGSYFLTRRARLAHGLSMSLSAALVQACSAILLVGVLTALFDIGTRTILNHAALLESVSYAAIAGLGLWMGWGVISGRVCCDHEQPHSERQGLPCDCGQDHGHDQEIDRGARRAEWWHVLSTGAAVGLRPCSGAILVLLFTLANGIFVVGVIATFAMAAGVALTVAVVSLGTLGLHRWLSRLGGADHRLAGRGRKFAALCGAIVIAVFGFLQLLGILTGVITPMAG